MIKNILKSAVLTAAMAGLNGCQLFSAVAYTTTGPGYIKAIYRPDAEAPMLVLVENYGGIGQLNQDATYLSASLNKVIKDNKIAPIIEPEAVDQIRESKGDKFRLMGVSDIAAAVGARQVLYVNVLRADLDIPSGGTTVSGAMEVRVRIIDARSATTRWPDSDEGEDLKIITPLIKRDSAAADLQVHHDLADKMAEKIGDLFHDWKPEYEDQNKTQTTGMGEGPG